MATAVMSRAANSGLDLDREIERQRELIRAGEITRENGQGGWTAFGKLIELRYELTPDKPKPAKHLCSDLRGNVVDWGNPRSGPLLGKARDGKTLLIVSGVDPLPPFPDPRFELGEFVEFNGNMVPLKSIPPDMRERMKRGEIKNTWGKHGAVANEISGLDQKLKNPRMIEQRYIDHACGTMGEFLVIRPLTEGLIKLVGINLLPKIYFESDGATAAGFYLNPLTGEAFFLGGKVNFG